MAETRAGARHRITWTERILENVTRDAEPLDLDRALGELGSMSERGRIVVELGTRAARQRGLSRCDKLIGAVLATSNRVRARCWSDS